jgi:hypothetical protein
VILDAADAQGLDSILAGDAAEVRPKPWTKLRRDDRCSLLGAEDTMGKRTDIGHAMIQPSLRDSCNCERDPAVNCRAIFSSPSGRRQGTPSEAPPQTVEALQRITLFSFLISRFLRLAFRFLEGEKDGNGERFKNLTQMQRFQDSRNLGGLGVQLPPCGAGADVLPSFQGS